jgi:signal recognition particle subunit SEC65
MLEMAIPATIEDPTEEDLASAAKKIGIMLEQERKHPGFFHVTHNLGALPDLWFQAHLTISLKRFFDKWSRVLVAVAAAIWMRGDVQAIVPTVHAVAHSLTIGSLNTALAI